MAIDGISGTTGSPNPYGFGFGNTGELQDQFMKIMLTQLRYQDPMEPLKEQEFLAQMAQFSSATQIGELNRTVQATLQYLIGARSSESLLSAANLIGKTFMAEVQDGVIEGVVESVCYHSGYLMVKSGEDLVPIESLVYVGAAPEPSPEGPPAEAVENAVSEGQVGSDAGQGS
jgi:flagellar basal-body rod modification protein FlgD